MASWWSVRPANRPLSNVEEHELLIAEAVKHAAKRIPIIAGTGANSTREAIELAAFSKKAGADASLYGRSLLQQADPGRSVSAFQGHRRGGGYAAHPVQRAGTHRCRHAATTRCCALRRSQHRRHQGRDRQYRARQRPVAARAQGFCGIQRRRCQHAGVDAAGRAWLDFGDRQRRARS